MSCITFRRVTRSDFGVLAGWLAEPHVARWWNHEFTNQAVERDFGLTADGEEPGEDHIALLDGRPIGVIQYSRYADYPEYLDELSPLLSVPDDAVSIDYLIGDPEIIGHGGARRCSPDSPRTSGPRTRKRHASSFQSARRTTGHGGHCCPPGFGLLPAATSSPTTRSTGPCTKYSA